MSGAWIAPRRAGGAIRVYLLGLWPPMKRECHEDCQSPLIPPRSDESWNTVRANAALWRAIESHHALMVADDVRQIDRARLALKRARRRMRRHTQWGCPYAYGAELQMVRIERHEAVQDLRPSDTIGPAAVPDSSGGKGADA